MTKRFEEGVRLMRSRDPQVQEDGFQLLLLHATDHVDELMRAFDQERSDHGLRCWLLELIGEARSPDALPLLVEQLNGNDESFRTWAVRGLELLNTKPAREQLWRARTNGLIS